MNAKTTENTSPGKRKSPIRLLAVITSGLVGLIPGLAPAIEEPAFTSEVKEGKLEIRRYAPSIVAEVVVTGPWRNASNSAFRLLADYIFGNNSKSGKVAMTAPVGMESTGGESEKIAMTAPVGMEKASTKIAMTAPVGMERDSDTASKTGGADSESNGPWRMSFTMPSEFTMDTLPKPNNPKVQIRQLPERTMAVIRFSGSGNEERFAAREKELREWIAAKGYTVIGTPNYSQYNPPWTPGILRRNEVIIPVKKSDNADKTRPKG